MAYNKKHFTFTDLQAVWSSTDPGWLGVAKPESRPGQIQACSTYPYSGTKLNGRLEHDHLTRGHKSIKSQVKM